MSNNVVRVTLPYSEVCMSMRVAGLERDVQITETRGAQILDENGKPFSFPITLGEAGLAQFARPETFRRELTEAELSGVLDSIRDSADKLTAAIFGVFRALDPDFDTRFVVSDTIQPTCYKIPKDQWIKVAEALQKSGGIDTTLSFMNYGPSSF